MANNFVNYENAEALMNGINAKIDENANKIFYGVAINYFPGSYNFNAEIPNYKNQNNTIVSILFTEDVPYSASNESVDPPTLSINYESKSNIVINNVAWPSSPDTNIMIKANTVVTMIYIENGTGSSGNTFTIISNQALYSDNILYNSTQSVKDVLDNKVDKKTTLDTYCGTCATEAATASKVVTVTDGAGNFSLRAGVTIIVKFSYTNTAQNPTLNVNGTGAKSIWYNTALITTGSLGFAGTANRYLKYTYDGTQWVWCGHSVDSNTTYSAMSVNELTTGTATTSRVVRADYLKQGIQALLANLPASDVKMSSGESVESAYENITILIPPNITDYASYKNAGGNRGEDITEYWKDGSLADRIDGVNGFKPFEGMYLWDYIDLDSNITAPSSGGGTVTGTKRIHIGEFNGLNNYQLNKRSDNVNFFNHLRMVTGTHFGMSYMNDTNTTVGGYLSSKMHTDIIGDISTSGTLAKQLYDQLGSLLVPTTELLTSSINASGYNRFGTNSGCSNNWTWVDVYARLLSEIESNGSIVWSSSGCDTGNAQHQLPAFKNDKAAAYPQDIYYWLKDIATSTYFCLSNGRSGGAHYDSASYVRYVRLLLTIGRKPS